MPEKMQLDSRLMTFWTGESSRKIRKRIVIEGTLMLLTPAAFASGESGEIVDMLLLRDRVSGRPLLPGASIAGALRAWLRNHELPEVPLSEMLFGGDKGNDEGEQSPLIVEDALGESAQIDMRDGVKINPISGTAKDLGLYNRELWAAGTTFPLRFELLVQESEKPDYEIALRKGMATALDGFSSNGITLGARKTRGYGRAEVVEWRVREFDLTTDQGLRDWIVTGQARLNVGQGGISPFTNLLEALKVQEFQPSTRLEFCITGTLLLDGSLLIRSAGDGTKGREQTAETIKQRANAPDAVHLRARQINGELTPILSGTSLAGALRARAYRIANTLGGTNFAAQIVDGMFGPDISEKDVHGKLKTPHASRVKVSEEIVDVRTGGCNGEADLVQHRVSIDRFTGGAKDTALFTEQPVFSGTKTEIRLNLRLEGTRVKRFDEDSGKTLYTNYVPKPEEIGLLLLLLKDLSTGDLPLGGEVSVGRGRLLGSIFHLVYQDTQEYDPQTWTITQNANNTLTITPEKGMTQFGADLNDFVSSLNKAAKLERGRREGTV